MGSATIGFLDDRAAIYFDMTDVDGTHARVVIEDGPPQALDDLTHVRITAIVQSDDRVTCDAPKQDSAESRLNSPVSSSHFPKTEGDSQCEPVD